MKTFAHWKNVGASRGFTAPDGSHQRDVVEVQTGPGHGPIQFIVDIPEETTRDEVIATWILKCGHRVDDATEALGFEDEWPADVRRQFDAGSGKKWSWPNLK
jgi:hypothetical protein